MKQCDNFSKGFSLIELLVVVVLIGIIGTITTQVFILGFRSQGKSEVLKEVKQNGDYAMSVMESLVRNAADVPRTSCNTSSTTFSIVGADGFTTTFLCSSNQIASQSSGMPVPTPTVTFPLTGTRVEISSCTFRVVCPTPPFGPKYIFINFTVSQAGSGLPVDQTASLDYQSTVSLRKYD